uniref:LigA n=1 Tax=Parastrongyloides trichosuri TaxID=131310 RepID=A0A0N4ZJM6_PARTI
MDAQIDLLAGDLSRQDAQGHVRRLVFRVQPRPLGHGQGQARLQILHAVAAERRDHEDLGIDARLEQALRQGQQGVAAHAVDLVQRQDDLGVGRLQIGDDGLCVLGRAAVGGGAFATFSVDVRLGVDQVDDHVRVLRPAPGRSDHGAIQATARREDAGRVHQHDLGVALDGDSAHGEARGLDLLGDDGDLGAGQPVHQRRLARIGRADDGGEARTLAGDLGGFGGLGQITSSRFNRAMAAAFSASCRERPWARA